MADSLDYEKTIEHQFDSFCKTVLRNFARDIYGENKRRNEHLISLESLSMAELSQLSVLDDYDSNYIIMDSYDYNIRIEDVLIAQAIGKLTKRKQDIIILSFFLGMTNTDIATLMNLAESTVHYHKTNSLKELKNSWRSMEMKENNEALPFAVILLAVNGDITALNKILKSFERYIIRL